MAPRIFASSEPTRHLRGAGLVLGLRPLIRIRDFHWGFECSWVGRSNVSSRGWF